MKRYIINTLMFLVMGLLLMPLAYSEASLGKPVWTIIPTATTTFSIPPDGTATVSYTVTNQSNRIHTLTMTPIAGITQVVDSADDCPNPFKLGPLQSCNLQLQVSGSALTGNVVGGPALCQTDRGGAGNPQQCYQPSSLNSLNITKTSTASYTVGGSVSGLSGTVVLQQTDSGDTLSITSDGAFTFPTLLNPGAPYDVVVLTQPDDQTCTVTYGSGTMGNANVDNVQVTCADAYTVGGQVYGLNGLRGTLTLLNNGGDAITMTTDGSFEFATPLPPGASYSVTAEVTGQICSVSPYGGTGVIVNADVTDIMVNCALEAYSVGGTVSGLPNGATVTLVNNNTESLSVTANGPFQFNTLLTPGASYSVTVADSTVGQTCSVTGNTGTGTINNANVESVLVNCVPSEYTVGGTVSGLPDGTSLTLVNNGESLAVNTDGTFTFLTQYVSGTPYAVTIVGSPAGQTCSIIGNTGTGTINNANVESVLVSCAPTLYSLGGTVTNLPIGTTVTLANNGEFLPVTANGPFQFVTKYGIGTDYSVTVAQSPAGQTCSVTGSTGIGSIYNADVTTVQVNCVPIEYSVGGTVAGLVAGTNITLYNNGVNPINMTGNGTFTFPPNLVSGAAYDVTVTVPTGQTCTVSPNGSGNIAFADVNDVAVNCTQQSYTIGGGIQGLNQPGLTLSLNGGPDIPITNGALTYTLAPPVAFGSSYSVTITNQPTVPLVCSLDGNSAGTVGAGDITVDIVCSNTQFPLSVNVTGNNGQQLTVANGSNKATGVGPTIALAPVTQNATYNVTVETPPTGQTCSVTPPPPGSGPMTGPVTVNVICQTATYTLGGTISNAAGTVTLLNNGLAMATGTTSFQFPAAINYGTSYNVTVSASPAGQTCTVNSGTGSGSGNVTGPVNTVVVTCVNNTYTLGGTITGATPLANVTLAVSGPSQLPVYSGIC